MVEEESHALCVRILTQLFLSLTMCLNVHLNMTLEVIVEELCRLNIAFMSV